LVQAEKRGQLVEERNLQHSQGFLFSCGYGNFPKAVFFPERSSPLVPIANLGCYIDFSGMSPNGHLLHHNLGGADALYKSDEDRALAAL
jgi:hypothetical protein